MIDYAAQSAWCKQMIEDDSDDRDPFYCIYILESFLIGRHDISSLSQALVNC